jgi:hypothetical protein
MGAGLALLGTGTPSRDRQRRRADRGRSNRQRSRERHRPHWAGKPRGHSMDGRHFVLLEASHPGAPSGYMALLHALGKHALKVMGAFGETGPSQARASLDNTAMLHKGAVFHMKHFC